MKAGKPNFAPKYSVVVPVYGSAGTLRELVERLIGVFSEIAETFEIVFVDDASLDHSWTTIEKLNVEHPDVVVAVQLMRNFGQHNALMCGFRHARGEKIITIDDDLQNPPEEIPKLIASMEDRHQDLVYGVPKQKKHAWGRNLGSWVVNAFFRLVFRTKGTVTSFRAISRPLLLSILSYDLNFTYIDGLLAWNTSRIGEVVVEHHSRANGRSGYSLTKLVTLAVNLFTNFSLIPLQLASALGLFASLCGFLAGIYYLSQSLLNKIAVPGYASIIVAVMTLGGLQLLALGVIGEYIGRLHLNVNRKPQYTERKTLRRLSTEFDDGVTSEPQRRNGENAVETTKPGAIVE